MKILLLGLILLVSNFAFAFTEVLVDEKPVNVSRLVRVADNNQSFCQVTDLLPGFENTNFKHGTTYGTVSSLLLIGFKLEKVLVVNDSRYPGLLFQFKNGKKITYTCRTPISS